MLDRSSDPQSSPSERRSHNDTGNGCAVLFRGEPTATAPLLALRRSEEARLASSPSSRPFLENARPQAPFRVLNKSARDDVRLYLVDHERKEDNTGSNVEQMKEREHERKLSPSNEADPVGTDRKEEVAAVEIGWEKTLYIAGWIVSLLPQGRALKSLAGASKAAARSSVLCSARRSPDHINLSVFRHRGDGSGPRGGYHQTKLPRLYANSECRGPFIQKDMARHGGSAWKLFNKHGKRIGTYSPTGKRMRG